VAYVSFLVGVAGVTFELVVAAERLRVAEVPQAARHRRVLVHVDAEVKKVLLFGGDSFAIQAPRLAGQDALKNVIDPRVLLLLSTLMFVIRGHFDAAVNGVALGSLVLVGLGRR
jgi:hypothetical protein